jgi:hypothetical protein
MSSPLRTLLLAVALCGLVGHGEVRAEVDTSTVEPTEAFCEAVKQAYVPEHVRGYYRNWKICGKDCRKRHAAWTRYRTERFGYFKGFGKRAWNAKSPSDNAIQTRFMGRKVRLNRWVVPVLKCVERDLHTACATCPEDPERPNECKTKTFPYKPKSLSGLRTRNTFKGGEVSNHVYGIALDVDPADNTCCGCTARWRAHPMCKRKLPTHERMIMPWCWVEIFETYGFYWLGRDKLRDTMHFDFLGDPDHVKRAVEGSAKTQ